MSLPRVLAAYSECAEHFDLALASPNGIAVRLANPGTAVRYRQKLNTYRVLLRDESRSIYPADHPQHGVSPFDHFAVGLEPGSDTVTIKPHVIQIEEVTEL